MQLNEPCRRPAWLPLYIIRARWGRAALTASTVGMGDCQAAAKYTQGSVSGSSSALSERRFRFSDNNKKKNRRRVCARWSQVTVVTGERSRAGDLCECERGPDLSEGDRHYRRWRGRELSWRSPDIQQKGLRLSCPRFVCVLWERYKKYRRYRAMEIKYRRIVTHNKSVCCNMMRVKYLHHHYNVL